MFPVKRWTTGLIPAYHDAAPNQIQTPAIPIRNGTQGFVLFRGSGTTLDTNLWETHISLNNSPVMFTSNQTEILCDLPWNVSTPRTV